MHGTVKIEVAPGELVDKLTILDIKLARMDDAVKRRNVAVEWSLLCRALDALDGADTIAPMRAELHVINEALWTIEDDIRDCERRGDFGIAFVELARAVYKTNDRRAAIKRAINLTLGSRLVEEKSYAAYA